MSNLKASFTGPQEYRSKFCQATAQLTISIGQAIHEGEKLAATLQLVNRSFAACKIMIDDSIQWYTLAIGKKASEEILLQLAIEAGDEYLARNQSLFKQSLTIPYEIIRWRDWLHTPAWQAAVISMHQAYQDNKLFRQAIDQNVTTFLTRYEKNHTLLDYDPVRARHLCVNYLLEECGVMKDLWITLGCEYEVYPSGRNEAMSATHALFIQEKYPHLLRSVGLRFNRKKPKMTEGTRHAMQADSTP